MELKCCLIWSVSWLLVLWPPEAWCVSVHMQNTQPVHVIPHRTLVLQARFDVGPGEPVSSVTWERQPETGVNPERVGVAEYPGKGANARVHVEQQGATLRVEDFVREDCGVYVVKVTDRRGEQSSAQCIVREYEAVHHVSVRVNVSHASLTCAEAWGTEPRFSWLHEQAAVPAALGHPSPDGTILYLRHPAICGHFTCMVSNSLGHSSATYTADPCEGGGHGTAVIVVVMVTLVICGGVVTFLMWWRNRQHRARGERLREPLDEHF